MTTRPTPEQLAGMLVEHLRLRRDEGRPPEKGPSLACWYEVSERTIREAVEAARRNGELIGSGSDGYFYARTADEMEPVMENLKKRARAIFQTRAAIKRELRRRRMREIQMEIGVQRPAEQMHLGV